MQAHQAESLVPQAVQLQLPIFQRIQVQVQASLSHRKPSTLAAKNSTICNIARNAVDLYFIIRNYYYLLQLINLRLKIMSSPTIRKTSIIPIRTLDDRSPRRNQKLHTIL